jgi:hypothetical protein
MLISFLSLKPSSAPMAFRHTQNKVQVPSRALTGVIPIPVQTFLLSTTHVQDSFPPQGFCTCFPTSDGNMGQRNLSSLLR